MISNINYTISYFFSLLILSSSFSWYSCIQLWCMATLHSKHWFVVVDLRTCMSGLSMHSATRYCLRPVIEFGSHWEVWLFCLWLWVPKRHVRFYPGFDDVLNINLDCYHEISLQPHLNSLRDFWSPKHSECRPLVETRTLACTTSRSGVWCKPRLHFDCSNPLHDTRADNLLQFLQVKHTVSPGCQRSVTFPCLSDLICHTLFSGSW